MIHAYKQRHEGEPKSVRGKIYISDKGEYVLKQGSKIVVLKKDDK